MENIEVKNENETENIRKKKYEMSKERMKENSKKYLQKLKEETPEKFKELRQNPYYHYGRLEYYRETNNNLYKINFTTPFYSQNL